MILDALEVFDAALRTLTSTGTTTSTNILDVGIINAQQPSGNQQRDIGPSYTGWDSLDILVLITATFTSSGSATLQVSIQAAVDNGGGGSAQTPGTFYDLVMTSALPVANLTIGREILRTPVPRWSVCASNVTTRPRFYRLNYTIGTADFIVGSVQAALVSSGGRQDNHSYLSGIPAQT